MLTPQNYFSFVIKTGNCFVLGKHFKYVYPTPPPWAGCDTKSIFKWNKAGLNQIDSYLSQGH